MFPVSDTVKTVKADNLKKKKHHFFCISKQPLSMEINAMLTLINTDDAIDSKI